MAERVLGTLTERFGGNLTESFWGNLKGNLLKGILEGRGAAPTPARPPEYCDLRSSKFMIYLKAPIAEEKPSKKSTVTFLLRD